ncbi:large ribosomal subunit protein mL51 [Petromyzon marinus]|uniref:large ribosomal subunit protein mL51 n=1 Tax=Petromyzon marinus TaxID=7757 RepID=UPI003F70FBEB
MALVKQTFGRLLLGIWRPSAFTQHLRDFSLGATSLVKSHYSPVPQKVDRWTEKRALFGIYDNVGILGDFKMHPKELISGPAWLRGWRGNELQRCIRRMRWVGSRMFEEDKHNLKKRIRFLYKRFNRYGKHR